MTILHALVVLFTEHASVLGIYFGFVFSPFSILVCAMVSELSHPQQTFSPQMGKDKFLKYYAIKILLVIPSLRYLFVSDSLSVQFM